MNKLPNDIARCNGVPFEDSWKEDCEDCLRRTSELPKGYYSWWIDGKKEFQEHCSLRIAPELTGASKY